MRSPLRSQRSRHGLQLTHTLVARRVYVPLKLAAGTNLRPNIGNLVKVTTDNGTWNADA